METKERCVVARKRIIDTEELYFKAELVDLLGARGLHLYIRLWGIAEDWGGYEPKYADIALKMGALRFTTKETERFIELLIENKKIIEYNNCGRKVHWIINFMEHQPLDNPSPPKLSLPEWINCELMEYKSGKKYAKYTIIPGKLPVGYQSATSNGVTVTVTKRNGNGNGNVTKGKDSKENPLPKDRFLDFVLLTQKEYQTLTTDLGEETIKEYIERLNNYIGAKGKEYKSHYHAIKSWYAKDHPQRNKPQITLRRPL